MDFSEESYREAVARRLRDRYSEMLQPGVGVTHRARLSELAELLGHPDAARLHAWFEGRTLPAFADLEQLAGLMGVEADHLKHERTPHFRIDWFAAYGIADWAQLLLGHDHVAAAVMLPGDVGGPVGVTIVPRRGCPKGYCTDLDLDSQASQDRLGAAAGLALFCRLVARLRELKYEAPALEGFVLPPQLHRAMIVEGMTHFDPWAQGQKPVRDLLAFYPEDSARIKHWSDYPAFCQRISETIAEHGRLSEQRDEIGRNPIGFLRGTLKI